MTESIYPARDCDDCFCPECAARIPLHAEDILRKLSRGELGNGSQIMITCPSCGWGEMGLIETERIPDDEDGDEAMVWH